MLKSGSVARGKNVRYLRDVEGAYFLNSQKGGLYIWVSSCISSTRYQRLAMTSAQQELVVITEQLNCLLQFMVENDIVDARFVEALALQVCFNVPHCSR